jgi:polygalacturonase
VDYGATGDGRILDTAAVQAAINACNAAGGGVVYFPAGGNFLIGTIYLKSKLTLHVEAGAQITGSTDMQQYGTDTGTNPYYPEPIDRCLIYAKDAADINITGAGAIVGHGPEPVPRGPWRLRQRRSSKANVDPLGEMRANQNQRSVSKS